MPIGRIQLKHGLESSADFNTMLQAEAYYATDTERLMISNGDGSGLVLPSKNEIDTKIGDLTSLTTTEKGSIVGAVNEIDNNLNLVQYELWKTIYPVGCLFETTDSAFNPQTHFGGTWEQYGAGRVTVGYSSGETEFNASGKTGGAKTHTHQHFSAVGKAGSTIAVMAPASTSGYLGSTTELHNIATVNHHLLSAGVTQGVERYVDTTTATSGLQPYITVFRWRRTA